MISCLPFRFLLAFLSFRRGGGGRGEEVLCGRGSHVAAARALQFAAFSFDPLRAFGEQRQPVAHALYLTLNVFAPPVSARRRHLVAQPALTNQRALKFLHFARFRDPFFCFSRRCLYFSSFLPDFSPLSVVVACLCVAIA